MQIRGDVELAQRFRELALLLRPDIEEEVSKVIGDVPAHHLGRFARAAFGWTRNAASTQVRNMAEYLAHERQHLVPRAEADQLLKGVDTLRENVDRLEARIELPRTKAPFVKLRVLARLLEIQRVLIRHGLDEFVSATHLYRPLRYATLLSPSMWFARRHRGSRGERLRLALQELGRSS